MAFQVHYTWPRGEYSHDMFYLVLLLLNENISQPSRQYYIEQSFFHILIFHRFYIMSVARMRLDLVNISITVPGTSNKTCTASS